MDDIDKLLEVTEHPEKYSDRKLEELLDNTETRESYCTLREMRNAMSAGHYADTDRAWETFRAKHIAKKTETVNRRRRVFFSDRRAATVAVWMSTALLCVAATITIRSIKTREKTEIETRKETAYPPYSPRHKTSRPEIEAKASATEDIRIFDNETLATILDEMGKHYECKVIFASENSADLRLFFKWDRTLPLSEIMRQLDNFEQIKISAEGNVITIE